MGGSGKGQVCQGKLEQGLCALLLTHGSLDKKPGMGVEIL